MLTSRFATLSTMLLSTATAALPDAAVVAAAAPPSSRKTPASTAAPAPAAAACRDRLRQPFAATSVWNHPLGSGAVMKPARIFDRRLGRPLPASFHNDQEWIFSVSARDPEVDWHDGYFGSCKVEGAAVAKVRLPREFTTDCGPNNNPAAILQPDNRTLLQFQPIYRGSPGGPMMGQHFGTVWGHGQDTCQGEDCDIFGAGRTGAHGGSGLSAIGGAIRVGELLDRTPPISHALKLELHAKEYYFWEPGVTTRAPECGGRNRFPPTPEKNELVLSIEMGCEDTVPFQSKPNTPF